MRKKFKVLITAGAFAAATAIATMPALADTSAQDVNLLTPFECDQEWNANTRTNHNPQLSVDFQKSDANNQPVLSSADGDVTTVEDLGNDSYGKYVVIEHAEGWSTLYAHLNDYSVSVGDSVSAGEQIGKVGSTGGSTGPHLHYEQKLNGDVQEVVLNGVAVTYYGDTPIKSSTNC